MTGCDETASSCARGSLLWITGRISSQEGVEASGCPEKRWSPGCWRYLGDAWTWHWGTQLRDGTREVRQMVGLGDLEGLFQHWWLYAILSTATHRTNSWQEGLEVLHTPRWTHLALTWGPWAPRTPNHEAAQITPALTTTQDLHPSTFQTDHLCVTARQLSLVQTAWLCLLWSVAPHDSTARSARTQTCPNTF